MVITVLQAQAMGELAKKSIPKEITNVASETSASTPLDEGNADKSQNPLDKIDTFSPNLQAKKSNSSESEYLFLWLKMILFLSFFLLGGVVLLKYIKSRKKNTNLKNEYFEVYNEFPIDLQKKLQIVKIVNEYYVLAITNDKINLITKIDNKEGIDLLELKGSISGGENTSFFQDMIGGYFASKSNKPGSFNALNVTRNLKEKLMRMKNN